LHVGITTTVKVCKLCAASHNAAILFICGSIVHEEGNNTNQLKDREKSQEAGLTLVAGRLTLFKFVSCGTLKEHHNDWL